MIVPVLVALSVTDKKINSCLKRKDLFCPVIYRVQSIAVGKAW